MLVVGAGSSGVQIADELLRAGKRVYLSVGPHDRPPRAYRGRDFCWWLGVLGKWDAETPGPGTEHVTIAVSGARGGETVDFRRLAVQGMTLVGRTESYRNGVLTFAPDLGENIARGDANLMALLDEADAYVARNGLDLPEEPDARKIDPDPECMTHPILELNLAKPESLRSSGRRAMASTIAGSRSTPSTRRAGRSISAAFRPSPGSISWACPGSRAEAPASSGASGTTPSMWRTVFRRSANIWPTMLP